MKYIVKVTMKDEEEDEIYEGDFECEADDALHALEQYDNAGYYPGTHLEIQVYARNSNQNS